MIGWAIYWDTLQPNPAFDRPTGVCRTTRAIRRRPSTCRTWFALPVDQSARATWRARRLRFGRSAGSTFAAVTTAITCGSVNCMHDSLNPLAGLTPLTGMWLNCVFGGKGVGLINMLVYLIVGVFLCRPDGRPHAGVPGQEGRGPRDEAGHAGPADPSDHDPGADRPVRRLRLGRQARPTIPGPTASRKSSTSSARRRRTTAPASRGSATPGASTTGGEPSHAGAVQRLLGHRHGPGHAARPVHPDHRADRAGGRAWRPRSRRRSRSARCAPTRSPSASCCWARSCWSGRCCSCRRRCWARWPSTWGRSRSAAEFGRVAAVTRTAETPLPIACRYGNLGQSHSARANHRMPTSTPSVHPIVARVPLQDDRSIARRARAGGTGPVRPGSAQGGPEAVVRHAPAGHPVEEPGDVRGRGRHGADDRVHVAKLVDPASTRPTLRLPDRPRRLAVPDGAVRQLRRGPGRGARQGPGRRPAQDAPGDAGLSALLRPTAQHRSRTVSSTGTCRARRPWWSSRPGQLIPGDGEIIEGVASVDESAITGESAPVIREAGGDRSGVTGGTRVLSDRIVVRITAGAGKSFLDRMIALVEGRHPPAHAQRDRPVAGAVGVHADLPDRHRRAVADGPQRRAVHEGLPRRRSRSRAWAPTCRRWWPCWSA